MHGSCIVPNTHCTIDGSLKFGHPINECYEFCFLSTQGVEDRARQSQEAFGQVRALAVHPAAPEGDRQEHLPGPTLLIGILQVHTLKCIILT